MGIIVIDTETIHDVTVGEVRNRETGDLVSPGTGFKVKAMSAVDRVNVASIVARINTTLNGGALFTQSDWDNLVAIIEPRVVEIEGYPDKAATLKNMLDVHVAELAMAIVNLSSLSENDRKNLLN
jgi:hypothetical protein